jgi:tetratricopeptide (TPR) repeat protein
VPERLRLGLVVACLLGVALPTSARATPLEDLLLAAGSTAELRASLLRYAETARDSLEQGEAHYYLGVSYERAGMADSAILAYEVAVARRNSDQDRKALVDALLRRRGPQDAQRSLAISARPARDVIGEPARSQAEWDGRKAWALYLAGQGDSAVKLIRKAEYWLSHAGNPLQRQWRYRIGVLEQDHGDVQRATQVLGLLAVESRFTDKSLMRDLEDALGKAGNRKMIELAMRQHLVESDLAEKAVLDSLGASRVFFTAADGASLSGIVFASKARKARAVVALTPPDTPVEMYDSLAVGLRRAGYSLILLDARGSGGSVSVSTPLPETWAGREESLQSMVADDVGPALRALAKVASVDTTRYLLVGLGPTAPIAVERATKDRRARMLMLIGPEAAPSDRGIMRARIAKMQRPVLFQIPSRDAGTMPFVEALYEAGNTRGSRIADSEMAGAGAQVFHYDATALPRLRRWLDDGWGSPSAPSSSRR